MYARLMTDMEDYQSRGINPKRVEDWENSRRSPCAKDCWEAWDFDTTLDDGAVLSLRVATKDGASIHSAKDAPVIRLSLVRGDGTLVQASRSFAAADCTWDEQELDIHCDDCELSGTLRGIHLVANALEVQGASAPAQATQTAAGFTASVEAPEVATASAGFAKSVRFTEAVVTESAETKESAAAAAGPAGFAATEMESVKSAKSVETATESAESTETEETVVHSVQSAQCTISLNLDFTALTRPVRPATGILDMGHDGKHMLG